jgi:Fe-S-cluster containining protein
MTEIQKLYTKIPKSICTEGCFDCCINSVQFAREEAERAGERECGEYNGICPFLDEKNKKCGIYENRPLVCRIYGVSEIMRCDGCRPENESIKYLAYLTEEETRAIIREYTKIKDAQERNGD